MKKHTAKFISSVLTATTLMSMLTAVPVVAVENTYSNSNENQIFTVTEDEKGIHFIGPTGNDIAIGEELPENVTRIDSASDYYRAKGNSRLPSGSTTATLPDSIDNSANEFFPEIDTQGSLGSCISWAQVYYQFTYTMNKSLNRTTTPENTFSPQWTYNMIAGTGGMVGIYYETYSLLQKIGGATLSQAPYDYNCTTIFPKEEIWTSAMKYRLKDFQTFEDIGEVADNTLITSPDDTDLTAMKTALSNGDVITYSTYINSWNAIKIKPNSAVPENNKYANEYIVKSMTGRDGGHRMSLVGYNDNIWTDINDNNIVDSGEMGAFKIANSWGKNYGNDGFMWISYDALNEVSVVEGVEADSTRESIFSEIARIDVKPYSETEKNIYLKYTLNTADRTQSKIYITAEKDGTEYTRGLFSNNNAAGKVSYDGTKNANDGTMTLLLNTLVADINSENIFDYNWSIRCVDENKDQTKFTVKNVEIVDELANKVYKLDNTYPFTLDGNEKTLQLLETTINNAVVYYRGYYNPVIHYKTKNGNWISDKGVAMSENIERRGYTHKYVIELGNLNSTEIYFSENGKVDNNNGQNYTAKRGLNYYVTENQGKPINIEIVKEYDGFADVNYCGYFDTLASGGYEPYQYQYIFTNLETGEEVVDEYREKTNYGYYFRKEGTYKVTVNVKDYSDKVTSTSMNVEVKNLPFEISGLSVTPDKQAMLGDELEFTAVTKNESIRAWGNMYNQYDFTVKKDGKECYKTTVKAKNADVGLMTSTVKLLWTPTQTGSYTVTISSTDWNKEYSEKTINFDVTEYNGTIIGDADNNKQINVTDALLVLKYNISSIDSSRLWLALSDCNKDGAVDIKDAICILRYSVSSGSYAYTGEVNYKEMPTEPPTEAPTQKPTEKPTEAPTVPVEKNIVTFSNAHNWSGTIYCYYWSDTNKSMTAWPGKPMTKSETNSQGQAIYTFEVPKEATYVIFSNGSIQTVDIPYAGGKVKYYPTTTNSKGHYNVATW